MFIWSIQNFVYKEVTTNISRKSKDHGWNLDISVNIMDIRLSIEMVFRFTVLTITKVILGLLNSIEWKYITKIIIYCICKLDLRRLIFPSTFWVYRKGFSKLKGVQTFTHEFVLFNPKNHS